MEKSDIEQQIKKLYSYYFNEKFTFSKFTTAFGFHFDIVIILITKTEFWKYRNLDNLLYFLAFTKNDSSILHNLFKIGKRTFQSKVWNTVEFLFQNLDEIKLENFKEGKTRFESFPKAVFIMDTTPFQVPKKANFTARKIDYSSHYGIYCWKYQILIGRKNGLCCSVIGPFHGSVQDPEILENSEILNYIPGLQILADRIYIGKDKPSLKNVLIGYRSPKSLEEKQFNQGFSSERVLIENFNSRLKAYKNICEKTWRYSSDKHSTLVYVLCSLINLEIRHGHSLRKK